MKIALVSMMGNVGSTMNSQGGGYGLIATKMVKEVHSKDQVDVNPEPSTWNTYDRLYVCEGVNFVEGSFNVPGGPQDTHYEKMKAIGQYEKDIAFINTKFDFEKFNNRLKIADLQFPEGPVIDLFHKYGRPTHGKAIIGDSHVLSVWRPGFALDFTAGRTLHGFLKRRTPQEINELWPSGVVLYFSNIDIRFHLMRQSNPVEATKELFGKYIEFAKQLNKVSIVEPLPIEHESRKIPGTGLYKGKPFYGTRKERMEIRQVAIDTLRASGLDIISWPEEWIDEDGTKMLDILEQKQSVHLRPKHYPYISEISTN
jgi:hypothetical protein